MNSHRFSTKRALLFCTLSLWVCTNCGAADEVIEQKLCNDTASILCTKWFSCWPVAAAVIFISEADCSTGMAAMCSGTELVSCDINNDHLRQCNDDLQGTACGQTPSTCADIVRCYETSEQ